ncbi:MAG TPA: FecR domain-containing protein [Vineibacter sp.]|nr:FecR domain-containing protein [Vineibacter sp.]
MSNTSLNRPLRAAVLSTLCLAAIAWPGAATGQVGVTSSSIGRPLGTPPTQKERILYVGTDVYTNEAIRTGADDRAHVLFTDGTALSIGPNSQLAIDRYVYDPDKRTGNLAVTVNKGVFRLVGGNITKSSEAVITTPAATIGVRGGISVVDATTPESVKAFFLFGEFMRVRNAAGEQIARRPGSIVDIISGTGPGGPRVATRTELAFAKAPLERPSGGPAAPGAGTPTAASIDQALAQSGVGAANSGQAPSAIAPPGDANSGVTAAGVPEGGVSDAAGRSGQRLVQPPPSAPVGVPFQGRFLADPPNSDFNPATLAAARHPEFNTALSSSSIVGGTTLVLGTESGASFTLPWEPGAGLLLSSANASSSFGPLNGVGLVAPGGDFFIYVFSPEGNSEQVGGVFGGTQTPTASFPTSGFGAHALIGIHTASLVSATPFIGDFDAARPAVLNAYNSPLLSVYSTNVHVAGVASSPTPDQRALAMQASFGVFGQGGTQSSYLGLILAGYTTDYTKPDALVLSGGYQGSLRTSSSDRLVVLQSAASTMETRTGTAIYGANGEFMVLGPDAVVTTGVNASQRTTQAAGRSPHELGSPGSDYYPVALALPVPVPEGVGTRRTSQTLSGYAGSNVEVRRANGDFFEYGMRSLSPGDVSITTNAGTNLVQATLRMLVNDETGNDVTLQMGGLTPSPKVTSAFIDDANFAATQSATTESTYAGGNPATARVIAVTQSTVPVQNFLPEGVSFCACEYLTWGYWAGEVQYASGPRAGQTDRMHLGTWVAGQLSDVVQIPTMGTATYNGHIVGNVASSGQHYLAAGAYKNVWNFGARTGAVTITKFDGVTYSGMTSAPITNARDFTGAFASSGRFVEMNGSFFRSPSDPVAYQAGSFRIFGEGYKATGIFAGQR